MPRESLQRVRASGPPEDARATQVRSMGSGAPHMPVIVPAEP